MRLVSETRPAESMIPATAGDFSYMSSDIAFTTNYLIQRTSTASRSGGPGLLDISNPVLVERIERAGSVFGLA